MEKVITGTITVTDERWCHCGGAMRRSDHCAVCGCEQFGVTCDHVATDQEIFDAIMSGAC